jgi:hypothetical protein
MRERETDPRAIMRNWATIASEVSSVVSPIERLVRAAAASDPDMAALLQAHKMSSTTCWSPARLVAARFARFLADFMINALLPPAE